MPTAFIPVRSTRAILLHAGDLRSNLLPLSVAASQQFADLQDTVIAGVVPTSEAWETSASYVPPDAAALVASGYDELYVDVLPLVRPDGSVGVVSPVTQNAFRQIALTDAPYWIIVRTDGYGQAASASMALQIAINVATWASGHALSLQMNSRLRGFAFLSPDLNVQFVDNSVIDRLFQNQLTQTCWSLGCACSFVTSRPADATCLIGPPLSVNARIPNPNSGAVLAWSILGSNPSFRDRIVMAYPMPQSVNQLPSVLLALLTGVIGSRGRDPGFPLNLDVAFVTPLDESTLSSDGNGGTSATSAWLRRLHAFAAALGVTTLGVGTSQFVVPAESFLPPDADVNTSGTLRASSTGGITTISYADVTGTTPAIVRSFDATFREMTPPGS